MVKTIAKPWGLLYLGIGIGLLLVSGCGEGNESGVGVALTALEITPEDVSIAQETTQQFKATGTFSDSTTKDLTAQVTWDSSDTGVATITAGGLATAVAAGSTTLTAISGSVSATTTLTVTTVTLSSLTLSPTEASIVQGATQAFTVSGTFSDGTTQDLTEQVTWSSSDTSVATLTEKGVATGIKEGSVTLTATSGNISATATLTVVAQLPASLAVTPATPSIAKGTTQQFTATGTFADNSTKKLTEQVTWSSSDTTVATVTSKGLATARAVGTTTITAVVGSVSATATLTVTAAVLSSIAISAPASAIFKGATQQMTATGTFSDSTTQDLTAQVTWGSSSTTVATIASTGIVTGILTTTGGNVLNSGTTNISASFNGVEASAFALTINRATLASIQTNVFTPRCAYCHSTADQGIRAQLDLSSGNTYAETVDVAGFGGTCVGNGNLKRIKPSDSDNSCLVRRVKGLLNIMPPSTEPRTLTDLEIETLTDWVSRGAPETN